MTQLDKENFNSFELILQEKTKELKSCQEENRYTSCMSCDSFIPCPTRKYYIAAVYESMNKGKNGGFEF